jgi:catechol 2,3-dioxygenase-like lactoylglutathione lyase family enzyme
MKFGYTIIYVPDVTASLVFFETAFGFPRRFLHESGDYGELETGETTLAFASHELGPWESRVFRACDGHDPEGNVIQFQENLI